MSDTTTPQLDALLEHRSWVRDLARRLVRDASDAEDLAQEAWVRVLRSPPDPTRDPRPWLRRVLKNLAANRWRGDSRRTARESAWRERRSQRTPSELVEEADQHQRLVRRVLDLEEPFKTTLVLRFYEGLSPREIAERLGVAEGTVHSRVARAVERLRDQLDDEVGGDRTRWVAALLPLAQQDLGVSTAATATTFTGVLIMLAKWKLAALTALALAAVIVGGLWIAADRDGAMPLEQGPLRRDVASDPVLHGTGREISAEALPGTLDHAEPDVVAQALMTGRVVDASGAAVPGAEVFLLPHDVVGVEDDAFRQVGLPLVRTDAEGAFRLPRARGVDRVVAFAEGYLPASAALADTPVGTSIELRLGDARIITVRVEDPEGQWPAGCGVDFASDPDRTFDRTSDPERLQWWGGIDPVVESRAIEQTLRVPTYAPLTADMRLPPGWASIPRTVSLSSDSDRVAFRLVRSGELNVRVIDGATGEPPVGERRYALAVADVETDALVCTFGHPRGEFHVDRNLAPGRYRLTVTVGGYVPAHHEVDVRSPGERVDLVLPVERLYEAAVGRLLLRITDTEEASAAVRALAQSNAPDWVGDEYVVFVRESAATEWSSAIVAVRPDGLVELRPHLVKTLEPGLPPGTYDLIVVRRDAGTAAFLEGVRVFGGQESEIVVALRPGSIFRVTDVMPRGETPARLEVRAAGIGLLPMVEMRPNGHWSLTTPADTAALFVQPVQPRILGPFPAAAIELTLRMADEEAHTLRVRGATIVR